MKNFVQDGEILTIAAPYDVTSGKGFQVGALFAVAAYDALSGAAVEGKTCGVFDLVKVSTEVWAAGDPIYWDNSNKRCTNVKTTAFLRIGVATAAAANPTATGHVKLGGLPAIRTIGGQATTATASDTIVTGLAALISVVATLDSDPGDDPEWVSASIGDQAGAPAAGSFLLKTWKNTSGSDPTPAAATTFSKKVNWIAYGY
jgi:predicted RecA/RadA family phage recombinase